MLENVNAQHEWRRFYKVNPEVRGTRIETPFKIQIARLVKTRRVFSKDWRRDGTTELSDGGW